MSAPGPEEDLSRLSVLEQVSRLKDGLVAHAQGKPFDGEDAAYRALRQALRRNPAVYAQLPDFIGTCSDLSQFWSFIRTRFSTYRERREFLWQAFAPVIEHLEANEHHPGAAPVTETLARFDAEAVHAAWEKALARRQDDPEGAITAARMLIETVCKHILDDADVSYGDDFDLPKLWYLTAQQLNLAPNQHQEESFRVILGNCQSIVSRLATIRNTVGDAHGQGRRPVKPKGRHAELAVNLAGTMVAFLIATWQEYSASEASP